MYVFEASNYQRARPWCRSEYITHQNDWTDTRWSYLQPTNILVLDPTKSPASEEQNLERPIEGGKRTGGQRAIDKGLGQRGLAGVFVMSACPTREGFLWQVYKPLYTRRARCICAECERDIGCGMRAHGRKMRDRTARGPGIAPRRP